MTENKICWEHWNHIKKTLSWSPRKFLCIAVLSIIPLRKTFFFQWKLFLFKALSKILKDFCQKYNDFSRIPHTFSIFKSFSRLVWTMTKGLNAMPWLTTMTSNTYSFLGKFAPLSKVKLDLPFNLVFSDVGAS